MGFHMCIFPHTGLNAYSDSSSGDVTLVFDNGRSWVMPDMILHYIEDHRWVPPSDFIQDVLECNLVGGERVQTKSVSYPIPVGYLEEGAIFDAPEPPGFVFEFFVLQLQKLMREADRLGNRRQTRGS